MRILLIAFISILSAGCNQQIKDFVRGDPGNRGNTDSPSVSTPNTSGVKISPGANEAQGTTLRSKFTITATSRTAQGTQVKSTFSFHSNRVQ